MIMEALERARRRIVFEEFFVFSAGLDLIRGRREALHVAPYDCGGMVGHTGVLPAVITAMECVDKGVGRILEAAKQYGYTLCVTADHGNADQMTETKKGKTSVRTAHSLNPVPFIIYDPDTDYVIKDGSYGLANVAPTLVRMMGLQAPDCWEQSMTSSWQKPAVL